MSRDVGIELSEDLAIGYDRVLARVASSISLGEGTHYLLARNGRGKTTLLRSLAGVLKLKTGVTGVRGVAQFVAEDIYYDKHLTPKSILSCVLPKENVKSCLEFADKIELDVSKTFRELSTGNKRKVSWLMAEFSCLPGEGNVLLLDEPFTGIDSHVRELFMEYWAENEVGVCRLVSCHPDFNSMKIESALLISEGEISATSKDEEHTWGKLKNSLV